MMGVKRIVVPGRDAAALGVTSDGAALRDDLSEGAEEPLDDEEELEEADDPLEESSELLSDESDSEVLLSDAVLEPVRPAGSARVFARRDGETLGIAAVVPELDVATAGVTTVGAT